MAGVPLKNSAPPQAATKFDGTVWQQLAPVGPALAARFAHAMTWDAGRSRVVLGFGTNTPSLYGSSYADLWEWNGTAWSQRIANGPARTSPMLGHDPVRGELVLFGGHRPSGAPSPMSFVSPAETYTLDTAGAAWVLRNNNGPTRSAGATSASR